MNHVENFASAWDAIADTPEQAANVAARAELMQKIAALLQAQGRTQAEAAKRCGGTQPRINDLLRGRVSRFSRDALVNIATALGWGCGSILRRLEEHSTRGQQSPSKTPVLLGMTLASGWSMPWTVSLGGHPE